MRCLVFFRTVNAPSKDARLPLGYPCVLASAARPLPFSLASLSKKNQISASKGLASLPPVLNTRFDCADLRWAFNAPVSARNFLQSKRILRTGGKDARPLEAEDWIFWQGKRQRTGRRGKDARVP